MAKVHWHTTANYYEMVDNGIIDTQQGRIATYIRDLNPPQGITRNTLFKHHFYVIDLSTGKYNALDGGQPLRWSTLTGRIVELVDMKLIKQSTWLAPDPDSDNGNHSLFLFPHTTPDWKLIYSPEKWADYLRQYPQEQQAGLGL
jgi:hypothetical protein